ncbi:hypothetical protein DFH28DRAFT_928286 [Melampsora americana]|nr:hypothetical protein DFH28DRAFT_928286 [Melampsora americana]
MSHQNSSNSVVLSQSQNEASETGVMCTPVTDVALPATGHGTPLPNNDPHLKGDDAPAAPADGHPLFKSGTFERESFDSRYEGVVAVSFKIHTDTEVVVDPENSINPAAARRSAAATVNVIDSKVFHDGVPHEIRTCFYGKSLNQFKDLAAEVCERYAPGMYKMVLHSEVHPNLTWKATVGRSKSFVLQDQSAWFEFVDHLSQSRARRASLLIHTESSKLTAKKKAQANAASKLINATNGPAAVAIELAQANERLANIADISDNLLVTQASEKRVALHVLTAELFNHYAESGNAGGDGVVLVAPWDPNFHYRFTLHDAFIWAKAIQRNEATKHMPPNISEYRSEIAKTRVVHPGMKLKDRLKLRLPNLTTKVTNKRKCHLSPSRKRGSSYESPSRKGGKNQMLTLVTSRRQKIIKLEQSGKSVTKQIPPGSPTKNRPSSSQTRLYGSLGGNPPGSPNKNRHVFLGGNSNARIDKFNIKLEKDDDKYIVNSEGFEPPPGTFMYLSDRAETEDWYSSADTDEIECLKEHEALLDTFVKECGVTKNYSDTRNLLINSGIKSWVDLVPSVKMTETALIELGVTRELAGRLLAKAQERHNTLSDFVQLVDFVQLEI